MKDNAMAKQNETNNDRLNTTQKIKQHEPHKIQSELRCSVSAITFCSTNNIHIVAQQRTSFSEGLCPSKVVSKVCKIKN